MALDFDLAGTVHLGRTHDLDRCQWTMLCDLPENAPLRVGDFFCLSHSRRPP